MTSQDAFNHPGLSAFAAVSHYPYAATSQPEDLSVSEVVNAVIDREHSFPGEAEHDRAASYRTGRYSTPFSASGTLEIGPDGSRLWTATKTRRGEGFKDLVGSSDDDAVMSPAWGDPLSSPAEGDDEDDEDDPDDTRKFYPDAYMAMGEERGGLGLSGLTEVDYAGFYQMDEDEDGDDGLDYDYDSTSHSEDMPITREMDVQNSGSGAAEGEIVSGGDMNHGQQNLGVTVDEFPVTSMFVIFFIRCKS